MAALQCEICGGKLIGKPGGIFECDSCGMEYSTEWAKAKVQEIKGTVKIEGPVEVTGTVKVEGGASVDSLLKRGWMMLEEEDWDHADEYFEKVLDIQPECAEAYAGKLCVEKKYRKLEDMTKDLYFKYFMRAGYVGYQNYEKMMRYAGEDFRARFNSYVTAAGENRVEQERKLAEKRERLLPLLPKRREQAALAMNLIIAGLDFTAAVQIDGTVVAAGNQSRLYELKDEAEWKDIKALYTNGFNIVGLKYNGTLVATGKMELPDWSDIVAAAMAYDHIVGLKSDGTVAASGNNESGQCDVTDWKDITAIAAASTATVGLKKDGTVVAAGRFTSGYPDEEDITDRVLRVIAGWQDIAAISAACFGVYGIKADGTVLVTDEEEDEDAGITNYQNVVSMCGPYALRADGTVAIPGSVMEWTDIVALAERYEHTVGVKKDGTVVADGKNEEGQCFVQGWKLFNSIDTLEQEREEAAAKRRRKEEEAEAERQRLLAEEERRRKEAEAEAEAKRKRKEAEAAAARRAKIAALEAEKASIQAELHNIKGLFSGGKRRELEARLVKIRGELQQL